MFGMGPWEIALVFLAILLLFGAKRLPEIARNMGKGIREFKSAVKDTQNEIKSAMDSSDSKDSDAKKKEHE